MLPYTIPVFVWPFTFPETHEAPVEYGHKGINCALWALLAQPFVHAKNQEQRIQCACTCCFGNQAEPTKYSRGFAPYFAAACDRDLVYVDTNWHTEVLVSKMKWMANQSRMAFALVPKCCTNICTTWHHAHEPSCIVLKEQTCEHLMGKEDPSQSCSQNPIYNHRHPNLLQGWQFGDFSDVAPQASEHIFWCRTQNFEHWETCTWWFDKIQVLGTCLGNDASSRC